MSTTKKQKPSPKAQIGCLIAIIIFAFIAIKACTPSTQTTNTNNFSQLSRERFDYIAEGFSPEVLGGINCLDNDCNNSVVYFNFIKAPEEGIDFITRANAVTFSNFKAEQTGTTHVTIISNLNGQKVLMCSASKGQVDECE